MKKVSVALLNYNGRGHLETFLPSVCEYSNLPDVELCLIDNFSTDDSIDFVVKNYPQIRIIQLDKNYGFAGGYNRGLEQIEATYYVLLNTDVEVTKNWLQPMIDFLDQNMDVVACQPKILSYLDKTKFEHAGAAGGFIDLYGYPFCRGRVFSDLETDNGQYNSMIDVFWATGACLFIRSNAYFEAGGLDDDFFAHMEEIDLCWRLKSRGKRIICLPQSKVYHLGGGTLNTENSHKTYLNFRNNLLMLYKNIPSFRFRKVFFMRWLLDNIAAFKMMLSGEYPNAKAVYQARSDFKKMKKSFKKKRKENMEKTVSYDLQEMYFRSLVLSYYIRKKNTYQKLKY